MDPYREDKPLADIIPPDRRRARALALIGTSMIAGACLFAIGSYALDAMKAPPPAPPTPAPNPGHLGASVLSGPDGALAVPPGKLAVLHVWLQGCADCMPAFEAMRDLQGKGGLDLDVPEINVSYGEADPAWAARYGVRASLVHDFAGSAVVRPLGITSFTTLVVDERGTILHRDRPDRAGYVDRLRSVVRSHEANAPRPLGAEQIERVAREQMPDVRRACWDDFAMEASSASVTADVLVGLDGTPTVTTSGDRPDVEECIRRVIGRWRFPRPAEPTHFVVPFKLVRQ